MKPLKNFIFEASLKPGIVRYEGEGDFIFCKPNGGLLKSSDIIAAIKKQFNVKGSTPVEVYILENKNDYRKMRPLNGGWEQDSTWHKHQKDWVERTYGTRDIASFIIWWGYNSLYNSIGKYSNFEAELKKYDLMTIGNHLAMGIAFDNGTLVISLVDRYKMTADDLIEYYEYKRNKVYN